jgi:hypothetical protein
MLIVFSYIQPIPKQDVITQAGEYEDVSMNKTLKVFILCLAALPVLAEESVSMIRTLPVAELVSRSDYIAIGEVRKIEIDDTHLSRNEKMRHLINEVIVIELLKGIWPPDKPMIFRTVKADRWIEDHVEFPAPGTRVVLFVKKGESGRLSLTNGIQGLWPLQGDQPIRMGTGKTIGEIRTIIEKQSRHTDQKVK